VTPAASACVKEVVRRVEVLVLVRRLRTLDRRYDGFPCYREENERSVGVLLGGWYNFNTGMNGRPRDCTGWSPGLNHGPEDGWSASGTVD
jgi:hypothetical protein